MLSHMDQYGKTEITNIRVQKKLDARKEVGGKKFLKTRHCFIVKQELKWKFI